MEHFQVTLCETKLKNASEILLYIFRPASPFSRVQIDNWVKDVLGEVSLKRKTELLDIYISSWV